MILLLLIALAVAVAAFATSAIWLATLAWREDRRWRRERVRMAAYHERMAARNGRPHTDAVTLGATRRKD